jgi:hypothetical protein
MMEPAVEGGVRHQLRNMSREDRRTFDGWLKANVAVGSVFMAALIAMALVGSRSAMPEEAAVTNGMKGPRGPAVTDGLAAAKPHADEATTEPLYPGRHSAICKPAPILGCLCETKAGPVSIFPQFASDNAASAAPTGDVEYSRLVEWLRLTCQRIVNSR